MPHPRIIDSHVHLWPESRAELSRAADQNKHLFHAFTGRDLEAAAPADIDGVMLVEHGGDRTSVNSELRTLARTTRLTAGLVGWSDLDAVDETSRLATLFGDPLFRAVRTVPGGREWLGGSAEALALLERVGRPLEMLVDPAQWPLCAELAAEHPGLTVVVEHVGLVTRDRAADLSVIAAQPNITAKLSAYPLDSPSTLRDIIDAFGARRTMFGSNWPVSLDTGSYAAIVEAAVAACAGLGPAAPEQVLRGTAASLYGIG